MRLKTSFVITALVSVLTIMGATSAAQQIRFPDFSSLTNLQLNGSTHQATWQGNRVLRLTDGPLSPTSRNPQQSSSYFNIKQPLTSGFTSWFEFQVHNPAICCNPGDGVAFIIQNSTATDPTYGARGAGITAVGAYNGGMGYAGINNNLAIEFDIQANPWDPNSNHVSVQSCGPGTNTPVHLPGTYTIGQQPQCDQLPVVAERDQHVGPATSAITAPADAVQTALFTRSWSSTRRLRRTRTWERCRSGSIRSSFPARILRCRIRRPIIAVPYNVSFSNSNPTGLNLDNGSAWVGFTGSQPIMSTAQDILAWEFTPHTPAADYADHSSRRPGERFRISAATSSPLLIPTDSPILTAFR